MPPDRIRRTFRRLIFLGGLLLAAPTGLLVGLTFVMPITASGIGYLAGFVTLTFGALAVLWRPRAAAGLILAGCTTIGVVAGIRIAIGGHGATVRIVTLPAETETRWIDRLFHERDLGLFGQELAFMIRFAINRREHRGLAAALDEAYDAINAGGGTTSSPIVATFLLQQRPAAFDAVVVEPPRPGAEAAVIYLHGFGGNLTVQGWLVAQGAKEINALTVAPSVGFIGEWWTADGEAIVRSTIDYVRKRGARRIYLAGLSNGARGVCRLAPKLKHDLAGLIVISGADADTNDAGLPVLALTGNHDDRISPEITQEYAFQAGDRGTFHEFDGDHLVLAKRAREVQKALGNWLRERETSAK